MTDIFRLLSRSTSFAKGAGSAAAKANPDKPSSKKRKSDDGILPKELDFFSVGTSSTTAAAAAAPTIATTDTGTASRAIPKAKKKRPIEIPDEPSLDPSEIKQLLRKHKLKYTQLVPPTPAAKLKKKAELLLPPLAGFSDLRISPRLRSNITDRYETPTAVQMGALPVLMSRDCNFVCCAPTGSGKTVAYVLPLLDWILRTEKGRVRAVVVAPTKELAGQIVNEGRKLATGTGVRVSLMKKGAVGIKGDVLVSTPAVLLHAIESGGAEFPGVERLVLDEADVLLDELFREQTIGIWNALKKESLRCSLFGATIHSGTADLATAHLPEATETIHLAVGMRNAAIDTITQSLTYTATEPGKLLALRQLFSTSLRPPVLIFLQTIARAKALFAEIAYDLPTPGKIAVLHADLGDAARSAVMARFLAGDIWVLVTTDLLARGIDFAGVRLVVNFDIPTSVAAYIHRVGRTGRAGRDGEAITYYTKEDVAYVKGIASVISASKKGNCAPDGWLIHALPKTSKRDKVRLKKAGVATRSGPREARISTKSGWEREKAQNKRGAVEGSKRRKLKAEQQQEEDMEEDEDEDEAMGSGE